MIGSWQSLWQSGRRNSPGQDGTGRTTHLTQPAAMLPGVTSRTDAVFLIREVQVRILPGAQKRRSAASMSGKSMDCLL
jgi:hypothetical protein